MTAPAGHVHIGMTGSRHNEHAAIVHQNLSAVVKTLGAGSVTLHHGACRTGADKHADDWATDNKHTPQRYPAKWRELGPKAGPIRNREMVLALWNLRQQGETVWFVKFWGEAGTMGCLALAIRAALPGVIVDTAGHAHWFPDGIPPDLGLTA